MSYENRVLCPNTGKCGNQRHVIGSKAYQDCLKASLSHYGEGDGGGNGSIPVAPLTPPTGRFDDSYENDRLRLYVGDGQPPFVDLNMETEDTTILASEYAEVVDIYGDELGVEASYRFGDVQMDARYGPGGGVLISVVSDYATGSGDEIATTRKEARRSMLARTDAKAKDVDLALDNMQATIKPFYDTSSGFVRKLEGPESYSIDAGTVDGGKLTADIYGGVYRDMDYPVSARIELEDGRSIALFEGIGSGITLSDGSIVTNELGDPYDEDTELPASEALTPGQYEALTSLSAALDDIYGADSSTLSMRLGWDSEQIINSGADKVKAYLDSRNS